MKYVSTAIGTVTIEIAANRPKTTPANSKPRPREIRRARGVSGEGRLTAFNQKTTTRPQPDHETATGSVRPSPQLVQLCSAHCRLRTTRLQLCPAKDQRHEAAAEVGSQFSPTFRQSCWWQTVGLIVIANGPLC